MQSKKRGRKAISIFLGYVMVVVFVMAVAVVVQYWLIHTTKQQTGEAETSKQTVVSCALAYMSVDDGSVRCTYRASQQDWWDSSFEYRKDVLIKGYEWRESYVNSTSLVINTTSNVYSASHLIFVNNYIAS